MNISFLLVGICLLGVLYRIHAQPEDLPKPPCPDSSWLNPGDCSNCSTPLGRTLCQGYQGNSTHSCCDNDGVAQGGLGQGECASKMLAVRESIIGCLATPMTLLRLSEHVDITASQYSQFICPSMKITLQCIRHTLWFALSLGEECTLDVVYGYALTLMGEVYEMQPWWNNLATELLPTCQDGFVYQDTCDNPSAVLDFRTAIFSNCAWSIMEISKYTSGSDFTRLQCMNLAHCSATVRGGYSYIVNCNSDQIDSVYDPIADDAARALELNQLTGFNMIDCLNYDRDCLFNSAGEWYNMVYCLNTPWALLNSSDVIDFTTPAGVNRACDAYLNGLMCVIGRYSAIMQLDNPSCALEKAYHPLFLNYLQYMANREGNLPLTAEVFNTTECRNEAMNIVLACPDREQIKTAIVVFCAEVVYRTPVASKCYALQACHQGLAESYRQEAVGCDTDSIFNFIESDSESQAELTAFIGYDVSSCETQTTPTTPAVIDCRNVTQVFAEIIGGSAAECVMTFTALLNPGLSDDMFCVTIWGGLQCAANRIHNDGNECFNDMKREIQEKPDEVYQTMERALGAAMISGIRERILNVSLCPQARITRPMQPVPVYVRQCREMGSAMMTAVQSCVSTAFNTSNLPECMRFGRAARCIANKLITVGTTERQTKLFEHMVEQCIELMVDVMEDNINQLSNVLGSLRPRECMKIAKVCGEGLWPSQKCGNGCPNNYLCEEGNYCCPMKRPGMCPKMNEKKACSRLFECDVDMDCHLGQKCCDQGCGYKTCSDIELREKSACEMKFESFKDRILTQRGCGDGTGSVHVPQCQNDKFGPIQGDYASGVLHCVTDKGMKIYGSEFRGNKNCPTTKPGKCPTTPSLCMTTPMDMIIGAGRTDEDCSEGQKMCYVVEQNVCQMKCVAASGTMMDTAFEICPNGMERNCCPVDMLIGKVCVGRPSAVPRINPCGGCHIEFYDEHNQMVNCSEGVSQCAHKRAMARMMNRDMTKNYSTNFLNFIKSRQLVSEGMMEDMGMDLEDLRLDFNVGMMNSMQEKYEKMIEEMNEYGMMARKMEEMENDRRMVEIGTAIVRSSAFMGLMAAAMCKYFDNHKICQNGGMCVIGASEPEYLQICKCEDGFHGLFCEISGNPSPDTPCMRYKAIVEGFWNRVHNHDMHGELVHRLLTLFKINYNLMPKITCTPDGMSYTMVQQGAILPYSPTNPMVKYCVDPTTGARIPNTLVALADEDLNCDKRTRRDVLDLPSGCRLQPHGACQDGGPCQYFYNSLTEMCEPSSRMGHGQKTLSQCYMECGFEIRLGVCPPLDPDSVGICPVCPEEGCGSGQGCCPSECGGTRCRELTTDVYLPKPCAELGCNWASDFCLVDETTGEGSCKTIKSYCMQKKDEGFGNKNIGAYYFNKDIRRCDKLTYKGQGGNNNRFYSLHQCQMECGVYANYKYDFPVCPPPLLLTRMEGDGMMMTMCESDHDCGEHHVCCSDGMQGVCTDPIRTCGTTRCSPLARCENDMCMCPTCDGEMMNEVCGDNGHRFDNLCMLKKYACEKMMNITVEPCPTTTENPPSMCPMACTLEYMPICTIEIMADGNHVTATVPNPCAMRAKKMCENRNIHPLYMGECETQCGTGPNCQPFETCMNGQCTCPMCGTELSPVCARPLSVLDIDSEKMTFPSICEMRRYGCQVAKDRMVISAHGPCEKIDPEYECPATKMDIVRSAEHLCHPDTNAYCSVGYKCCPYGAGSRCVPMKYLKRESKMRPGFCPILSYINYDMIDCYKKELMCEDDADVPPNMKCCDNMACGHKTIAAAIGLHGDSVCGAGKTVVPGFTCSLEGNNHACPMGSMCTEVTTREGIMMSVCCETAGNSDPMRDRMAVYGNRLCNIVEQLGADMICNNNGRCIGDVNGAQMCECPKGYFGTFCEMEMFDYDCPNSENTPCFDNPCNTAKCHIKEAYCEPNYCNGCNTIWKVNVTEMVDGQMMTMVKNVTEECHAPRCDRLSGIYSTVFGLIHERVAGNKMSRKKRDGHGGGGMEEMDMYDMLADPIMLALPGIMKGMGIEYVPHDGVLKCENGSFAREQCFESLDDEDEDKCTCVHPMTGTMINIGPMVEKKEDLECNFVSNLDFPEFCKDPPSNASCSGDETEMWYFCPVRGECAKYTDRGCNSNHKNSFPTMALCQAKCGAMSATPLGCELVRCPGGTVCTRVHGEIQCLDVKKVDIIHEYPEPDCEENGDYSPMQCQGNTCYCVTRNGTVLPNTFGMAQTFKCYRDKDGNTMAKLSQEAQAKECADPNAEIMVCDGPGDPCNNCQMPNNMGDGNMGGGNMGGGNMGDGNMGDGNMVDGNMGDGDMGDGNMGDGNMGDGDMGDGNMGGGNMGGDNMMGGAKRDPKVDVDGKCTKCETCPSGQGNQACTNTCESAPVCKQFPGAMCKVDKCTCEIKYYKSGNQTVNCNAAQSQCEKAKMALEQEGATRALQMRAMGVMDVNSVDEVKCSAGGAFYAICVMGPEVKCYCLNATTGNRVGQGLANVNIDSLDCTETQRRTITKRLRASVKISDLQLAEISVIDQNTVVAYFRNWIRRRFPNVKIIVMRLISGSVRLYYEIELDETVDSADGTTDIVSIGDAINTEIMDETVTVGNNVFIPSEVTVIEFLTEEDLPTTTPVPTKDDDDNTGLIIGCVLGGVALLFIIVAVIVICNRNKKSKSSSMQFSDLQGKDNPIYPYKA